jgi:hypothetical protein
MTAIAGRSQSRTVRKLAHGSGPSFFYKLDSCRGAVWQSNLTAGGIERGRVGWARGAMKGAIRFSPRR